MRPATGPPRGFLLPAVLLLAIFAGQSYFSSRLKSPVFDEPAHIAAGLSYLETGNFSANRQHPPFLKEVSAALMLVGGVHWPDTPEARSLARGTAGLEWTVGNTLIRTNGPDRVLFWARLPFSLLATGLGALLYVWGREMIGEVAALGTLFLYALDPTLLAHSYLVTTDVGVAALGLLFFIMLWRYLRKPDWKGVISCGLVLGLALTAKFSALILVPLAMLLVAVSLIEPQFRDVPSKALALLGMYLIALVTIQVVYFSPSGLASYVDGLRAVNADHDPDYLVFMAGQLQHRFACYFLVAFLLKEPLAILVLVAAGLVAIVSSRKFSRLQKWFLLAPPAVFAGAYSFLADDLGIRYLIPVLPFAYLIGGTGLAWLVSKPAIWARGIGAALCLWLLIAAVGIYPDHMAYFNEAACLQHPARIGWDGGTRCGPEWLDDSNVDWGQGLKQLKDWVDRNGRGRALHFAYFGSFPPDAYGLPNDPNAVRELAASDHQAGGLYAVSAHWLARIPALVAHDSPGRTHWLAQTQPTAIVGHSIYLYAAPQGPVARLEESNASRR